MSNLEADRLRELGNVEHRAANYAAAMACYQQAMVIYRGQEDRKGEGTIQSLEHAQAITKTDGLAEHSALCQAIRDLASRLDLGGEPLPTKEPDK